MMKFTRTVYNLGLSVLICILLLVSSLQGTVLCIGKDVHVAPCSDCCGNVAIGVSQEASKASLKDVFSSNKDNCSLCVDVPISVGLVVVFKKPKQVNPMFPVSTTTIPVTFNSFNFSECHLASESFAIVNLSLISLRTIILLI